MPPRTELAAKVDVGLGSITRTLEELCRANEGKSAQPGPTSKPHKFYSMVFVARGNQSSAFNCHFPRMIGAASRLCPHDEAVRLVGFSKPCSDRLCSSLALARVSSVAIARDAPGAEALWKFVQKTVPPVDVSWMDETHDGRYQPTRIQTVESGGDGKRKRMI